MRNRTTVSVMVLILVTVCAIQAPASEKIRNSVGIEMVPIGPGSFFMGQAKGGDFDERPVHKVDITRAFYTAYD